MMCSAVFGAGLDEELARQEDLGYIALWGTDFTVDYADRSVTALCLVDNPTNATYKAIFRDYVGCTLVETVPEAEIRAQQLGDVAPPPPLDPVVPWPEGEGFFPEDAPPEVDQECLAAVAAEQFANQITNPRAILVSYKGQLVYEEYAPGITKANRLLGWSATKTITQALVGILVGEGRINVRDPAPVPEWYEVEGDARQNITYDMMLRMSSGTRWTGDLGPSSECLFWSENDCPHVCGLKPLVLDIDTEWNYNSGSTYLLSYLVNQRRGDPELTNWEWPKHKLFYPINAHSMYIEFQPNGNFLGGAYGYATARDWLRFGLLYQRDGVWTDGTRIFPEGWVQYTGTATPTNARGEYAAHAWKEPTVDPELFYASGFRNQNVYVFPSRELVVARFAMPPLAGHPVYRDVPFLEGILSCIRNTTAH